MSNANSDPGDEQPACWDKYAPPPWSYRLWPGRHIVFEGATLKVQTITSGHVVLSHVSGSTAGYRDLTRDHRP